MQDQLAAGLDEAAIAAVASAAGGDAAVKVRPLVRPHHHFSAIAHGLRACIEYDIPVDVCPRRVLLGALALVVAADENLAAASHARGVDACVAGECNPVAQHLDAAAAAGVAA